MDFNQESEKKKKKKTKIKCIKIWVLYGFRFTDLALETTEQMELH